MSDLPEQPGHRPARREILQAGLLVSLSGCSGGSISTGWFDDGSLRLATPWDRSLCEAWQKEFDAWLMGSNLAPLPIRWLPISENELFTAGISGQWKALDGVLGGHQAGHQRLRVNERKTFALRAFRTPVVISENGESRETQSGRANVADSSIWPLTELELDDPLADTLSRYYLAGVWASAPDIATAYARFVLLARGPADVNDRSLFKLRVSQVLDGKPANGSAWKGGKALARVLGIEPGEPTHWPEGFTLFEQTAPNDDTRQKLIDFMTQTNKLKPNIATSAAPLSDFAIDLAWVLLERCRDELKAAWRVIEASTGEQRQKTERYLAERPPWPPASVQDLARRRGFEYVVALVEQIAADGDERDWLIHEFQQPAGFVEPDRMEKALDGRLKSSVRFRAWLRAEWQAWVRQRCRRVQRFLTEL